ncbi:hypothetical protein BDV95DRAFT_591042 [Massariosphaeria phaeospora]|uniref:Uncharacterized protein n=1 Tax=Massariosphaeria phaeospora TaxID=100035 RepID=A0A7C8MHI7_9PLEO|nr:hypothetical protein BDV95DRAFT_591042 [Massariosphaeria phaeospora]
MFSLYCYFVQARIEQVQSDCAFPSDVIQTSNTHDGISHANDTGVAARLVPRALDPIIRDWILVKNSYKSRFVGQNEVKQWDLTKGTTDYATAQFYGCTIVVLLGSKGLGIAHALEGTRNEACSLETADMVEQKIMPLLDDISQESVIKKGGDGFAFIMGSTERINPGVKYLIGQVECDGYEVDYRFYIGGSKTPMGDYSEDFRGKLMVRVRKPDDIGKRVGYEIYQQSNKAIRLSFNTATGRMA